jgi:Peptidase A4 family
VALSRLRFLVARLAACGSRDRSSLGLLIEIDDLPPGWLQQQEMRYRLGFIHNEERDKRARQQKLIGAIAVLTHREAHSQVVAMIAPAATEEDAHARLAESRAAQIRSVDSNGQVTDTTEVTPPPEAGQYSRAFLRTINPAGGASRRQLQVIWVEPGQAIVGSITFTAPAILDVWEVTSGLLQRQRERLAQGPAGKKRAITKKTIYARVRRFRFVVPGLVLLLVALVGVGSGTGASQLQTTQFQSGYMAVGGGESFSKVSASWTVPTVTCPPGANTVAVQWPGIGGNNTVVQDGTQEACVSGTPEYSAWCELYGDGGKNAYGPACDVGPNDSNPVSPGDAITGSISISGAAWTLALADTTQRWGWSITFPNPSPGLGQSNAEAVVECPTSSLRPSCSHYPLADFGTVRFSQATADLNGKTSPLSALSPYRLQTVIGSTLLAAPGAIDPKGGFTDTWHADS